MGEKEKYFTYAQAVKRDTKKEGRKDAMEGISLQV